MIAGDELFLLDARLGPQPVVAAGDGPMIYVRDGTARRRTRFGVPPTPVDRPRLAWLRDPVSGSLRRYLLHEQARENKLLDSAEVQPTGTAWVASGGLTFTEVAGAIEGESGWRFENDGSSGNRQILQNFGLLGGGRLTLSALVENHDADISDLGIRDDTFPAWVALYRLVWSDLSTALIGTGAGSGEEAFVEDLGIGPNGGQMVRFTISAIPNNFGNSGTVRIYATGTPTNTRQCIVHHVQLEVGRFSTSPIVTTSAAVTRPTDAWLEAWPHLPSQIAQDGGLSIYLEAIDLGAFSGLLGLQRHLILGGTGAGSAPNSGFVLFVPDNASSGPQAMMLSAGSTFASVEPDFAGFGQRVRLLAEIFPDGPQFRVRIGRRYGDTAWITRAASQLFDLPAAWTGQKLAIGSRGDGGGAVPWGLRRLAIVRGLPGNEALEARYA